MQIGSPSAIPSASLPAPRVIVRGYTIATVAKLTGLPVETLQVIFGAALPKCFTFGLVRELRAVAPGILRGLPIAEAMKETHVSHGSADVIPLYAKGRAREAAAITSRVLDSIDDPGFDYERAVKALRRSLALDPHQPDAWAHLGIARWACGAPNREVEAFYRRAIAIDSRCAEALFQLAVLIRSRSPSESFSLSERAALAAPDDLGIQDFYHRALRRRGLPIERTCS